MKAYLRDTRAPRYSLLFALPLLIAYEGLAAILGHRLPGGLVVRNGADVLMKGAFIAAAGPRGPLIFAGLLVAASVWLVWRDLRGRGGIRPRLFALMAVESVVLAMLFGVVVGAATAQIVRPLATLAMAPVTSLDRPTQLMVSLGAGLYEELLFRVVLVSAVAWGGRRLGWRPGVAGAVAAVVGALVFSAFHYVGPYGDELRLQSFVFRAVGGLAFSALYLFRGFGITAWTHALYDVFLLVA